MIETVLGFRQRRLMECGIGINDAFLINGIIDCINSNTQTITIDNVEYYKIAYSELKDKAIALNKSINSIINMMRMLSDKNIFKFKNVKNEDFLISFNNEMMIYILSKDRITPDMLVQHNIDLIRKEINNLLSSMDMIDLIGIKTYLTHIKNQD